jgi:hypothetical protein
MAEPNNSIGTSGNRTETLPRDPSIAVMLAMLYEDLGGGFSVSSDGRRYYGIPEPCQGEELPQLPDAAVHERFHCEDEWRGAIKLICALLQRLDRADSELVFGLMATTAIDSRRLRPSIEDPKMGRVQ